VKNLNYFLTIDLLCDVKTSFDLY